MAKRSKKKSNKKDNTEITLVVLIIVSLLLGVLIFLKSGFIGAELSLLLGGLLGFIKYIVPIGIFAIAISIACHKEKYVKNKIMQMSLFLLCICVILCIIDISNGNIQYKGDFWSSVKEAYVLGQNDQGGGALGAIIAIPLISLIGIQGTIILNAVVAIFILLFILGLKPSELIVECIENIQERREKNDANIDDDEKNLKDTKNKKVKEEKNKNRKNDAKTKQIEEIPMEDQIMINIPDERINKEKLKDKEHKKEKSSGFIESNLFKKEVEKKEEKTKEILTLEHTITIEDEHYEFPPLEFLEKGEIQTLKGGKKTVTDTATKLQKTLFSFRCVCESRKSICGTVYYEI